MPAPAHSELLLWGATVLSLQPVGGPASLLGQPCQHRDLDIDLGESARDAGWGFMAMERSWEDRTCEPVSA